MLTYLDSLLDAMAARDLARLRDLVDDNPLVRLLPMEVLAEVRRFLSGKMSVHAVPMVMLRFRDQTARLLSETPRNEVPPGEPSVAHRMPVSAGRRGRRGANQIELPLSA